MRFFLKNNKYLILSILLLLLVAIFGVIKYKIDYNQEIDDYYRISEYLKENPNINVVSFPDKPVMYDTYTLFSYILVDSILGIMQFVLPLLIMLCGSYNFYKKLKTGFFKDECLRSTYKKRLIINILDSWKVVLIIPLYLLFIFIGCYLITGSFDINSTIERFGYSLIPMEYLNNLPKFFFFYVVNLALLSIYYVNICLITTKKGSNFIIMVVQSYLIFIIAAIFVEVAIGQGLQTFFPSLMKYNFCNSLSIFNFWVYDHVMSLEFMFAYAFFLFIISTAIVILKYKDKEVVFIENDK